MFEMNNRQNEIVNMVNAKKSVSIKDIKDVFPTISEMTIRRDLETLDREGLIVRIHGGAKSFESILKYDDFYAKRAVENINQKQIIAKKALRFIVPDSTIFLDSGSTVTEFAKLIPDKPLTIFTGNVSALTELAKLQYTYVSVIGGKLNARSLCISGNHSYEFLHDVNFSYAFMGVTGFDIEKGFTCGDEAEYRLKNYIVKHAIKRVAFMDSSKVHRTTAYTFANFDDIDIVVSDGNLPKEITALLINKGVEII